MDKWNAVGKIGKTTGFTFTWRIEDFTFWLLSKGQRIDSPVFRIEQLRDTEWKLILDLPDDEEDNIALNLRRCEGDGGGPHEIDVRGKLFIAKNDGSQVFVDKLYSFFLAPDEFEEPLILSRKKFIDDSNAFLHRDTLTVGFKFFVSTAIPIECSGRSKLHLKTYSIFLPLKFPESSDVSDEPVVSPTLSTSPNHPSFVISLSCRDLNRSEFPITVQIQLSGFTCSGFLKYKLSFMGEEGLISEVQFAEIFDLEKEHPTFAAYLSKEAFDQNSLFKSNRLKCELIVTDGDFASFLDETVYVQDMRDSSVENHFDMSFLMEMYSRESYFDFKIIVSDREFSVHKIVLAAVSPVFRSMFESGMTEAKESKVTIEDFSVEAVDKMLKYSYSGNVDNLSWNDTLELYSIADKYQIQKLKSICSTFLKSALCVETVPDLLLFSDLHEDKLMSKAVEDFICRNSKSVFKSDAWKHFMRNNVEVACGTMYRICQSVL